MEHLVVTRKMGLSNDGSLTVESVIELLKKKQLLVMAVNTIMDEI